MDAQEMWQLTGDVVAHWRCGGSGNVVAHWRCGCSGDVAAQWRCGGSLEIWWLIEDVVA